MKSIRALTQVLFLIVPFSVPAQLQRPPAGSSYGFYAGYGFGKSAPLAGLSFQHSIPLGKHWSLAPELLGSYSRYNATIYNGQRTRYREFEAIAVVPFRLSYGRFVYMLPTLGYGYRSVDPDNEPYVFAGDGFGLSVTTGLSWRIGPKNNPFGELFAQTSGTADFKVITGIRIRPLKK